MCRKWLNNKYTEYMNSDIYAYRKVLSRNEKPSIPGDPGKCSSHFFCIFWNSNFKISEHLCGCNSQFYTYFNIFWPFVPTGSDVIEQLLMATTTFFQHFIRDLNPYILIFKIGWKKIEIRAIVWFFLVGHKQELFQKVFVRCPLQ